MFADRNAFAAIRPLEAAGGRQSPATVVGDMPPTATAASRRTGAPIGVFLHLIALAVVGIATIGIFFGIAFSLLPRPADALVAHLPTGAPGKAATAPQRHVPSISVAARGAPRAAAVVAAASSPPGSTPAMPRPTVKVAALAPMTVPAKIDQETKAPAAPRPPDRQLAALVARGDVLLRGGDIASARLFYERAADEGDGHAALRVGATFDPAFLARVGFRNMSGDPAKALFWYRRALGLGAGEAQVYLNRINTKSNGEHRE